MRPLVALFAVVACGLVTVTAARPDTYHYEWTVEVEAPVDVVERQLVDLHRWLSWSSYDGSEHTFAGSGSGPGSSLTWKGDVSAGHVALTRATQGKVVLAVILVERPIRSASLATFSLASPRPGITTVTWQVDGKASRANRLLMGLGVLEGELRGRLIVGLQTLKEIVEADAAVAAMPTN